MKRTTEYLKSLEQDIGRKLTITEINVVKRMFNYALCELHDKGIVLVKAIEKTFPVSLSKRLFEWIGGRL